MSGGWAGSTRKQRLPADWVQRRSLVIARDGVCQWPEPDGLTVSARTGQRICGRSGNQVDHVVRGDDHQLSNLQLLCEAHHNRKSAAEGGNSFTPLRRAPEAHPGLR